MLFVNDGLTSGWARCVLPADTTEVADAAEVAGSAELGGPLGLAAGAGWATGMLEVIVLAVNLTTLFRADSRSWRMLAVLVTLIAVAAIVSTYHVFNNMYDEPAHLAAGMEWLARGTYTYEPQHPPLDKVFLAPKACSSYLGPAALGTFVLEQPVQHLDRRVE